MLCFFMFLMTVSSAPLALVHEKQAKNYVALFQNKTLLSELAEADPGTLNTILGLLEGLLDASVVLSLKYTTDVEDALGAKNDATATLAAAVIDQTTAREEETAAKAALETTVVDVGTADRLVVACTTTLTDATTHHEEKVGELNDKQAGVDAESATLRDTIALIQTLLPAEVEDKCVLCDCKAYNETTKTYSNCKFMTPGTCTKYCVRCEQDGTTPMAGNWPQHDDECLAYSRTFQ